MSAASFSSLDMDSVLLGFDGSLLVVSEMIVPAALATSFSLPASTDGCFVFRGEGVRGGDVGVSAK